MSKRCRLVQFLWLILFASVLVAVSGCGKFYQLVTGHPKGILRVVVHVTPLPGRSITPADLDAAQLIFQRRLNPLGSRPYVRVARKKGNYFVIDLGGVKNTNAVRNAIRRLIETRGSLEFYHLKNVNDATGRGNNKSARWVMNVADNVYSFTDARNPGSQPITDPRKIKSLVIGSTKPILTGADLVPGKCTVEIGRGGAGAIVALVFTQPAQAKFAAFTRTHIHEFLAITLDDSILTAPIIQTAIPGNPIIEGNFTASEAQNFVDLLNAGAMPVRPKVVSMKYLP